MKMITLLFVLLSIPTFAQKISTEPFKGANKIEIVTGLSSEENFVLAGRTLIENGYEIDQKDKEFGLITTRQRGWTKTIHQEAVYYLKVITQNEKLLLTGEISTGKFVYDSSKGYAVLKPDFSPSTFTRIECLGKGGMGAYVKAYLAMEEIARLFPDAKLTFIEEEKK